MIQEVRNIDYILAEVIIPLSLGGTFTYSIPPEFTEVISPGMRVAVQFGRTRIYSAIVLRLHHDLPLNYQVKPILYPIDEHPVITSHQIQFWKWISEYYMCFPGEVMQAALPSVFKLSSETMVLINPDFDGDISNLNEKEVNLIYSLGNDKELSLAEVSRITGQKKVIPLVKTMIEKGLISVVEEVRERVSPKIETYISLAPQFQDEENLRQVFDKLEKRGTKQLELLMAWIYLTRQEGTNRIRKAVLMEKSGSQDAALLALLRKGILVKSEEMVSRFPFVEKQEEPDSIVLTGIQEQAFLEIKSELENKEVVLLNGVTSSGKTEMYIKLIHETISAGKQVLYLLPEIALTTQIINRLKRYFGSDAGVYHSKHHEQERVEVWNQVLGWKVSGEQANALPIVLGARSALFLPFQDLGLIVVDEEHDSSFKQQDPAPRYHARDAAIVLAKLYGAKVLLGSATPSIESTFNAVSGKYGLVEVKERYGGIQLPEVQIVDLVDEIKKRRMKSSFSSVLLQHIEEAVAAGEQVILFQNRRGFSLRLECESCHWVPECKNCDVSLTYHKIKSEVSCHYCGYAIKVPARCPQCGGSHLKMKGFGTERIEEELTDFIPGLRVGRMDLDSTRGKHGVARIISIFEEGKIDVLVGTQMVTKGLDFDRVSLVGIMNADNMLNFPDFRAFERSFQLMAQVSGRAGRKKKRGKVLIQTYNPYHIIIKQVMENNYDEMFHTQLYERKQFKYPPYYRMIQLTLKHKDAGILSQASRKLAEMLRLKFGQMVLGPEYPVVSRISNLYLKQIILKIEKTAALGEQKKLLTACLDDFGRLPDYKSVRVIKDVDPF